MSQLKRMARSIYSNPPTYGARIAAEVVNDPSMFEEWKGEMKGMAGRITRVRGELEAALKARMPAKDWSFITRQIGMFSFTGMTPAQVRPHVATLTTDKATNKRQHQQTTNDAIKISIIHCTGRLSAPHGAA